MTFKQEVWYQDPADPDLWLGQDGLLVNTTALEARADYFEVIRVPVPPQRPAEVAQDLAAQIQNLVDRAGWLPVS